MVTIKPQPKQAVFLKSTADIAFYGGAAGGGKSYALILDPLRFIDVPGFTAALFRRSFPQLVNPGGLLSETLNVYPLAGGVLRKSDMTWTFPSGAVIKLGYIGNDLDVYKWQGAQLAMIGFDELTHFTEHIFWYMLSRNRSGCGVKPYVRATMNPDADHFAAKLLAWYIGDDGYAIPERSGVKRWFLREGDTIRWVAPDARDEAGMHPKSFTFIAADVYDNPALLSKDRGYLSNLLALPTVERERLLLGNWKIKAAAGTVFHRDNLLIAALPVPTDATACRFWDVAATKRTSSDYTAGVLMVTGSDGLYQIRDVIHGKYAPSELQTLVRSVADSDKAMLGADVTYTVGYEQEAGSSGVIVADLLAQTLAGHSFAAVKHVTDKMSRALPLASMVQAQRVRLYPAAWNEAFIRELHGFPDAPHDDLVDAAAGAFNVLAESHRSLVLW